MIYWNHQIDQNWPLQILWRKAGPHSNRGLVAVLPFRCHPPRTGKPMGEEEESEFSFKSSWLGLAWSVIDKGYRQLLASRTRSVMKSQWTGCWDPVTFIASVMKWMGLGFLLLSKLLSLFAVAIVNGWVHVAWQRVWTTLVERTQINSCSTVFSFPFGGFRNPQMGGLLLLEGIWLLKF